ncbi:MAG: Omp28-related outer membrane protein [Paramuribaculum sp.]|nr:Omp28-related outer membrane protein [Paramuribaculum sp.]MDE6304524.1 Omp28-related outer membrane protein [Paramuribaculum sp.]
MKKISTLLKLCLCLLGLATAQVSSAVVFNLGYAQSDDDVYPSDGYSFNFTDSVHVAVRLTPEMISTYKKGNVTKILLGWSDMNNKPVTKVWVRESLDGPDIAIGHGAIKFGWNTINLDTPLELSEYNGDLIIGYTTKVEQNVCCIPTRIYGSTYPNSQYLGANLYLTEEGKIDWSDESYQRPVYLLAEVNVKSSDASNMAKLTSMRMPMHIAADQGTSTLCVLENLGYNAITNIELTYTQGEWSHSEKVKLSQALAKGKKVTTYLPIFAHNSGDVTVSISKVNNKDNNLEDKNVYNVIAVPENVSKNFTHRLLFEFYTSENNYHTPSYFDGIVAPGLRGYEDNIIFIAHHARDQFMIEFPGETYCYGDQMMIDMYDGDSLKVSMPSMLVDRCLPYLSTLQSFNNPVLPIIYPDFVREFYNAQLKVPTFGDVTITSDYSADKEPVKITINGTLTPGILPEGEYGYLNVMVVEDNVESYDQTFWDEDEAEDYEGKFTHRGIVRLLLSERYGDAIETDENGNFTMTYNTEIDPESGWNPENMRIVAFISRDFNNHFTERTIINANQIAILKSSTGILAPDADGSAIMRVVVDNRRIKVEGADNVKVYTATGMEVNPASSLAPGIYVVKATAKGKTSTTKVFVK